MNRTYLQAIAVLMGTAAITFIAAEWRWEPTNAGDYVVIIGPASSATAADGLDGLDGSAVYQTREISSRKTEIGFQ